MRLQVLMMYQDDPKKCTAAKMARLGLARAVRRPGRGALVLDPFADRYLLRNDANGAGSLVCVDCSWRKAESEFARGFGPRGRRLPPLLAGNPVNYSKVGMLSTAEAAAAALYILGYGERSREILAKFAWGHTFFELNENLLQDYSGAKSAGEVDGTAADYGLRRATA